MNIFCCRQKKPNQSGFTLIELSIVIIIVGLLVAPLLSLYHTTEIQKKINITKENISTSVTGISTFSPVRLPCPSDRSLGPDDPQYGFEQCNLATIPTCTTGLEGICKTNGSRDADGVGGVDLVIIGGVPFRYMAGPNVRFIPNVHNENTMDGWNNKLTYAVSAKLMDPTKTSSQTDFKLGVIAAVDENGNPTAGIGTYDLDNLDGDNDIETGRDGDAQFVVLSSGPSGRGAFTLTGAQPKGCPASTVVEYENCDNDFTFVQGLGSTEASGNSFIDDYSHFYIESSGDLWYILPDGSNAPSPHINNLNSNFVGINTTSPSERLDVNGNIMATTVKGNNYCDKTNSMCMPATYLSPSRRCSTGQVVIGYKNGNVVCSKVTLNLPGGYTGANCPGGANWVQGVTTDGCVLCTDGNKYCS